MWADGLGYRLDIPLGKAEEGGVGDPAASLDQVSIVEVGHWDIDTRLDVAEEGVLTGDTQESATDEEDRVADFDRVADCRAKLQHERLVNESMRLGAEALGGLSRCCF